MMKKRVIWKSSVLLLSYALVVAGCSNSDELLDGMGGTDDNALVPITFGVSTQMQDITRAVVSNNTSVTAGILGWETSESNATYSSDPTWGNPSNDATTITFTANTTEQKVNWGGTGGQKHYNAKEGIKTYMFAYYPQQGSTFSAGKITFTPVNFNEKGSEDFLIAQPISGSKTDKSNKKFEFTHASAQLKFKPTAGEGMEAGTKLKKISVKNMNVANGFDLTKSVAEVIWTESPSDIEVFNHAVGVDIDGEVLKISNDAVVTMVKPTTGTTIQLDIETTTGTFTNVPVTINQYESKDGLQAGVAYTITLTFKQAGIDLTASVSEWKEGTASGVIM